MTRVTIANVTAPCVAGSFQARGLSGTIFNTLGFGAWGVEPGVTIELAGAQPADAIEDATRAVLAAAGESAAYVNTGAVAFLLAADGSREELES